MMTSMQAAGIRYQALTRQSALCNPPRAHAGNLLQDTMQTTLRRRSC